ncbi:MAG: RloB family protein [Pseudomonadota bacterium]
MGRDNSPKERQRRQLERKLGRRASHDRILIVSEGSKTEPNYFKEIRAEYRLHSANVEVQPGALGTEPIQVVDYARELFENGDRHKGIRPRVFEQVYAVFDRDDHRTFHNALARARALDGTLRNDLRQPVKFAAIPSRPSFEFWLLLHFEDVRHLIHRDEAMRRLKRFLADYEKGSGRAFAQTKANLPDAIARARDLMERVDPADDSEPYTGIVELVELLTNLKR